MCSNCGSLKTDLTLQVREYVCDCGLRIDRNVHAAINLKQLFHTKSSSGIYACGQDGSEWVLHEPNQPAWMR